MFCELLIEAMPGVSRHMQWLLLRRSRADRPYGDDMQDAGQRQCILVMGWRCLPHLTIQVLEITCVAAPKRIVSGFGLPG